MSLQQEMHFESGLLRVEARGEFSLDEAKRGFIEVLEAVARYEAEKVLIDGRKVTGKPEVIERFYYGVFAAEETSRLGKEHRVFPRFAYVLHEPVRDPGGFGEYVAANRGMIIKTFENPEEAIE